METQISHLGFGSWTEREQCSESLVRKSTWNKKSEGDLQRKLHPWMNAVCKGPHSYSNTSICVCTAEHREQVWADSCTVVLGNVFRLRTESSSWIAAFTIRHFIHHHCSFGRADRLISSVWIILLQPFSPQQPQTDTTRGWKWWNTPRPLWRDEKWWVTDETRRQWAGCLNQPSKRRNAEVRKVTSRGFTVCAAYHTLSP